MKSRAVCCCLFGLLVCPGTGHPETFHQYRGKNGEMAFTNILPAAPAATELQRAREQAEIEYWRAREARARSLRHTPDTDVHRKRRSALQEETSVLSEEPAKGKYQKRVTRKTEGADSLAGNQGPVSREVKKGRSRKTKVYTLKQDPVSPAPEKKAKRSRKVALK
jgi:hypothetical protein